MRVKMSASERFRQERNAKPKQYPKGFDISLADIMANYNLDEGQIKMLETHTHAKRTPLASLNNSVGTYYRKHQVEELLGIHKLKGATVDTVWLDESSEMPDGEQT